jgi:ketosteroid isomerase-like protein
MQTETSMRIELARLTLIAIPVIGLASCRRPIPPAPNRDAIAATVQGFHDALKNGDRAAVMSFLADDAQILETGHRETREQYENGHLASDIEFAKAVPTAPGALIVRQEGDVAWTSAVSRSAGTFRDREVDTENAELMVLARKEGRWQIRAVHWSGHAHR